MTSLLLIGSGKSPYLHSLIKSLVPFGFETDMVDPYEGWFLRWGAPGKEFFSCQDRSKTLNHCQRARFLHRFLRGKKYDVCNVHYNSFFYGFVAKVVRSCSDRLVVSIWGDDMTNPNPVVRRFQRVLLDSADKVTINNPDRKEALCDGFRLAAAKVTNAYMPIEVLNWIALANSRGIGRREAKIKMGWEPDRNVILCGTNASPEQRHVRILESMEARAVNDKKMRNSLFVFPFTYEGRLKYVNSIMPRIQASSLETKVFDRFLSEEELVWLRLASDIMVQVQTKDMFSAALQEAIFAGSWVVTGSWLPYDFLRGKVGGLRFVDEVNETGGKVGELLGNGRRPEGGDKIRMFGDLEIAGRRWASILGSR